MSTATMSVGGIKKKWRKKKFSVHSDPDISSQRRRQFVYFRNSFEIEFKALFGREDSFVSNENIFFSAVAKVKRKNVAKFNFEIDFSIDIPFENVKVNFIFRLCCRLLSNIFFTPLQPQKSKQAINCLRWNAIELCRLREEWERNHEEKIIWKICFFLSP